MSIRPNPLQFSKSRNDAPPHRLGIRYSKDRFLPEGGNTVVCHLDLDNPLHEAILSARAQMYALPGGEAFLRTPIESLHMTVFEGALESRRLDSFWPKELPHTLPMPEVAAALLEPLKAFQAPESFSVRVEDIVPTGLVLTGATEADEVIMRSWRDALTEPFGYRHPSHDSYRFHMTFAYSIDWIADEHLPQWDEAMTHILQELSKAVPVIPLRAPSFCTFEDMTHFEEILPLR